METKQIQVKVYRCPDSKPTCSSKAKTEDCVFLRFRKWGQVSFCAMSNDELFRDNDHGGFIRPSENCPVWGEQ